MSKDKLHLIMPMGGAGSRFFNNGYLTPKPLIDINGKPFLYWATRSIQKYIDLADITFVVLNQHIEEFEIDKTITIKSTPNDTAAVKISLSEILALYIIIK